jgi:hypothetical protein
MIRTAAAKGLPHDTPNTTAPMVTMTRDCSAAMTM